MSLGAWASSNTFAQPLSVPPKLPAWGKLVPICYHNMCVPGRRSTSTRSAVYDVRVRLAVNADKTIRLVYPMFWDDAAGSARSEAILTAANTIQAYVIFPNGEESPVTFDTMGYQAVSPTFGYLVSDPIVCSAALTRDTEIRIRSNQSVATAAANVILENYTATSNCSTQFDGTNVLADVSTAASRATAITDDQLNRRVFVPIVVGTPTSSSVNLAIIGHSYFNSVYCIWGTGQNYTDFNRSGIVGQALYNKGCSIANLGASAESIKDIVANGCLQLKLRSAWLMNANRVLVNDWANDLQSGRTSVQIMADLATLVSYLNGLGITDIWVMTQPPLVTSTDKFLLKANQTAIGSDAQRLALNTALVAAYGSKCIDIAADLITQGGGASSYPDATVFKANVTFTGFNTLMATWTEASTNAWGYYQGMVILMKSNTTTVALRNQSAYIDMSRDNTGNAVRADLHAALPASIAAGDTGDIYGLWTVDGIHPGTLSLTRYGTLMSSSGLLG